MRCPIDVHPNTASLPGHTPSPCLMQCAPNMTHFLMRLTACLQRYLPAGRKSSKDSSVSTVAHTAYLSDLVCGTYKHLPRRSWADQVALAMSKGTMLLTSSMLLKLRRVNESRHDLVLCRETMRASGAEMHRQCRARQHSRVCLVGNLVLLMVDRNVCQIPAKAGRNSHRVRVQNTHHGAVWVELASSWAELPAGSEKMWRSARWRRCLAGEQGEQVCCQNADPPAAKLLTGEGY